ALYRKIPGKNVCGTKIRIRSARDRHGKEELCFLGIENVWVWISPASERIAQTVGGEIGRHTVRWIERDVSSKLRGWQIVVDAKSGTNRSCTGTGGIKCQAHARAEVVVVSVDNALWNAFISDEDQTCRRVRDNRGLLAGHECGSVSVLWGVRSQYPVAQPHVYRQAPAHPDVVL